MRICFWNLKADAAVSVYSVLSWKAVQKYFVLLPASNYFRKLTFRSIPSHSIFPPEAIKVSWPKFFS
jgi:hypothetical protein